MDPLQNAGPPDEVQRDVVAGKSIVKRLLLHVSGPMMGVLVILALCLILLPSLDVLGSFFSLNNLRSLLHSNTVIGIVALGMLLIIISGGIDLSVGSVVALVTVVAMQVYLHVEARTESWKLASLAALPAGIATGAICGLINGLMVTGLKVTPFVATLGMLSVARGLAYWAANSKPITFAGQRPPWVDWLQKTNNSSMFFDLGVWSLIGLAIPMAILLRYTVFGRYTYAIGSSEATSRLCGVAVERNKILIYTVSGLLTGWAGIVLLAQGNSGNPNAGVGLELDVIAAVVIGGASLTGGQGTVTGTMLGVLVLGVLVHVVSFSAVSVEAKHILIGTIIIVNTAFSRWQRGKS